VDANGALDEARWMRTVKSCGPDAPTLASSGDNACALRLRWWQESPVTRESAKETVKTIAQGMLGDLGGPVVTTLVCFHIFAREAAGASRTRHSLRPLLMRAVDAPLGRYSRRGNALCCLKFESENLGKDPLPLWERVPERSEGG
jgi:hypothetical protein